jgi:hypothetical protein
MSIIIAHEQKTSLINTQRSILHALIHLKNHIDPDNCSGIL